MNGNPPYAGRKLYLSGIDWFVRALDSRTRAATGAGSYSQIVLVLRKRLDPVILRERLVECFVRNPLLSGRCRRNPLNLAPYWEASRSAYDEDKILDVWPDTGHTGGDPPPALAFEVNRPLPGLSRVAFVLVPGDGRSYLAMRFDHQVLDAVGAERLLRHIGAGAGASLSVGDRHAHLNRWLDKFRSGRVLNRALLALRGPGPPVSIPVPPRRPGLAGSLFVFRRFGVKESGIIFENAERRTGYLMLLPFLLGVSVKAFHDLCLRTGVRGNHYIVPVTLNARRPADGDVVFFNHFSMNFYRFEAAETADCKALWRRASQQMYRQARDRMAYHATQAGYPMRILPAAWLGRLLVLPMAGNLGSFSFALVADKEGGGMVFMDAPVENVYHMPRVPVPPGIGIYFTRYQGRFNLVISYLDGMLPPAEVEKLADAISRGMLDAE